MDDPRPGIAAGREDGVALVDDWRLVLLASFGLGLVLMFVIGRLVPVYLSVDGAHAVTDARALLGAAPRPPYYLPAFPSLLILLDLIGIDPRVNVTVVLGLVSGGFIAALYWLVRSCCSRGAAVFATLVAAGSTALGELLGWQGGATLLALVGVTTAFAAFIAWSRSSATAESAPGRSGLIVGTGAAVAIASHPFVALFGLLGLAALWLDHASQVRRWTVRGLGPLSVQGLAIAAVLPAITLAILLPSYRAIETPTGAGLRLPDLATPLSVFAWLTRESPALVILTIVLLAAAVAGRRPGRTLAAASILVFILLPAVLAGDASYQTRVGYLLAPAIAFGAATIWTELENVVRARRSTIGPRTGGELALVVPIAMAIWAVSTGLPQRLAVAVPYYSSLSDEDYALIRSLAGSPSTVATGWLGNRYWDGMLNAWYVEGLANRPAIGPTDPALTTRLVERSAAAMAWQLFSGQAGLENGALQTAFGPPGWRADPAIAARIDGSYLPLVFVADASNDYGPSSTSDKALTWAINGTGAAGTRADARGRSRFQITSSLDDDRVHVTWERATATTAEPWTIWIWPAYGLPWRDIESGRSQTTVHPYSVEAYRDIAAFESANPTVTVSVTGGATIEHVDRDPRYHVEALAIHVPATSDLELVVGISGTEAPDRIVAYNERDLIRTGGIGASLVWRDSGWPDRFSTSTCFRPAGSDAAISGFDVTAACRPGR